MAVCRWETGGVKNMGRIGLLVSCAALAAMPLWGYKSGPDAGHTGAPGESNCTACHFGTVNSGAGSVRVELVGATHYTPGLRHTLRVTVTQSGASRWGFQLSARLKDTTLAAGQFSLADPLNTRMETVANGLQYVTHTETGTQAGTASPASWTVEWTAPPAGAGPVVFFVAGNAANRDGAITGDSIYTASAEFGTGDVITETKSYALPQIAFGGAADPLQGERWITELYFTNTGESQTSFTVDFYGNDGNPLPVPYAGSTTTSVPVLLAPGAMQMIQLASSSPLVQGWASVSLPSTVKGLGIFRQSINGKEGQEAMVPLSEDSKQNYVMIWDDAGFDTVMAVANPGDTAVTVNFTVRTASGNQLGTGSINLDPKKKEAFMIRERLVLPSMVGQRGAMDISISSGKVALLGLKFGKAAFTSMMPIEK